MIEEHRDALIERCDPGHLVVCQSKIEYVKVLSHPFLANRLGDDHNFSLNQPAKDHLGYRLVMGLAYQSEGGICEEVVSTFSKRSPGLDLNSSFAA